MDRPTPLVSDSLQIAVRVDRVRPADALEEREVVEGIAIRRTLFEIKLLPSRERPYGGGLRLAMEQLTNESSRPHTMAYLADGAERAGEPAALRHELGELTGCGGNEPHGISSPRMRGGEGQGLFVHAWREPFVVDVFAQREHAFDGHSRGEGEGPISHDRDVLGALASNPVGDVVARMRRDLAPGDESVSHHAGCEMKQSGAANECVVEIKERRSANRVARINERSFSSHVPGDSRRFHRDSNVRTSQRLRSRRTRS